MRDDYTNQWSIRKLKTARKWQRKHRHIEVCRNAARSLTEVIKKKQAKAHKEIEVTMMLRYQTFMKRKLAMEQFNKAVA